MKIAFLIIIVSYFIINICSNSNKSNYLPIGNYSIVATGCFIHGKRTPFPSTKYHNNKSLIPKIEQLRENEVLLHEGMDYDDNTNKSLRVELRKMFIYIQSSTCSINYSFDLFSNNYSNLHLSSNIKATGPRDCSFKVKRNNIIVDSSPNRLDYHARPFSNYYNSHQKDSILFDIYKEGNSFFLEADIIHEELECLPSKRVFWELKKLP